MPYEKSKFEVIEDSLKLRVEIIIMTYQLVILSYVPCSQHIISCNWVLPVGNIPIYYLITKEFINCQLQNHSKNPGGKRYTEDFNFFALSSPVYIDPYKIILNCLVHEF
jgi:hypothetical protein